MTIEETKRITVTAKPLTIIGEVAVGARSVDDPEFRAAARLLLTKYQAAPANDTPQLDAFLEAVIG